MSSRDDETWTKLFVVTSFLWQNADFLRSTLVNLGRSMCHEEGKNTPSKMMNCTFEKELISPSCPSAVSEVSLGRSSSKKSEGDRLRMMMVLHFILGLKSRAS